MKINKNSWHYKFIKEISGSNDIPHNLCPYVRKLMLCVLIIAFFASAVLFASGLLGSIFILKYTALHGILMVLSSLLVGIVVFAVIVAVLFGIVFGLGYIKESIENKKRQKRYEKMRNGIEETPTIIGSWVKAKHDKICPRLEFEGDD